MKNEKTFFLDCVFSSVLFFFLSSCAGLSGAGGETSEEKIALKYPVVLVHGIVFNDRGFPAWGRIPETLENAGARVFFGNTDSWGDFDSNALILKETIEKILLETNSEKVNIIAHSKGGIDSRYLIWKHDFGDKVASLTTICTPHRGAEIADLIYAQDFIHTERTRKALETFGELFGDTSPDVYNVNYHLTTEVMKAFNERVHMDSRVYYQSFYTSIASGFDAQMFAASYRYIKKISGANDGLVSEESAKWGVNTAKIEGRISHTEILDLKKRKISGVDIPSVYTGIIKALCEKGF